MSLISGSDQYLREDIHGEGQVEVEGGPEEPCRETKKTDNRNCSAL